jgi:hypothetical protein
MQHTIFTLKAWMHLQAAFALSCKANLQLLVSGSVTASLGSDATTICKRLDQFNTFLVAHANTIHGLRLVTERPMVQCVVPLACSTTSFPMYWYGPSFLHLSHWKCHACWHAAQFMLQLCRFMGSLRILRLQKLDVYLPTLACTSHQLEELCLEDCLLRTGCLPGQPTTFLAGWDRLKCLDLTGACMDARLGTVTLPQLKELFLEDCRCANPPRLHRGGEQLGGLVPLQRVAQGVSRSLSVWALTMACLSGSTASAARGLGRCSASG